MTGAKATSPDTQRAEHERDQMRKIRLRAAKVLTYIQLISIASIYVYISLSFMFAGALSNRVLLTLSIGLASLGVFKHLKVTPYLKE